MDYFTNRKSRVKTKALPCNVVCASSREVETDVAAVTDSEETIVLATDPNAALAAGTRSGQQYLKKYDEMVTNSLKLTPEPTNGAIRGEEKELRYAKTLLKDKAKGSLAPYRFDVLAQLANIPARIALFELLRLSKSTKCKFT